VLLPGAALAKTSLGFCDHHVVEMLAGLVCIHLLNALVVAERERPGRWWRPAWVAALPLAAFQFTWVGAPLWLPVFALALGGQLVADVMGGAGAGAALRAAGRFWGAFLIWVAGAGLLWPELVMVPWLWRFTLVGTVALLAAVALAAWLLRTPKWRARPVARLATLLGVLVITGVLAWVTVPAVRSLAGTWLGPKPTVVSENIPVTAAYYFKITGLAGVLALLVPVVGVWTGAARRAGWWVAVLPSLGFLALWARTHDYGYQGALHAVVLSGYLFAALPRGGRAKWAVPAGATLVVALGVWPLGWTVPLWKERQAYARSETVLATPAWREAMAWLREARPAASEPPGGRAGVLTDWTTGNLVNTLGRRPSTSSRFPEAEGLRPLFAESEAAARAAVLRGATVAEAVRFVALEPRTIGEYFKAHSDIVGMGPERYVGEGEFIDPDYERRLLPTLGARYEAAFAVRLLMRDGTGMGHFRLVHESRQEVFLRLVWDPVTGALGPVTTPVESDEERARWASRTGARIAWKEGGRWAYQGQVLAAVKVFEQVAGARVTGRAEPGASVTLRLAMRLRTSGRTFHYEQEARAGDGGEFELVCPYATEVLQGGDLEPFGPAEVVWLGGRGFAHIPEAAVQDGTEVRVVAE
jgi:asparagine N-glycosylation enzyme membrane subunit Stt3